MGARVALTTSTAHRAHGVKTLSCWRGARGEARGPSPSKPEAAPEATAASRKEALKYARWGRSSVVLLASGMEARTFWENRKSACF